MEKQKYLVTGGAGFIGSHLVDRLLEEGNEVLVLDDFSSGDERNLDHQKDNPNLKVFKKSICDKDISELFKEVSVVFHLAAIPNVQFSIKFPEKTHDININGTLNLLERAKEAEVKRFVYSSSSAVYGNPEELPLDEDSKINILSPYALQKLTGEYYCKLYNLLFGMETISLRYFNVYGPRQNPSGGYAGLIPKTIASVLNEKNPIIYGDGNQTRDFVYVNDVVEANLLAAKTENKEVFGDVFNIGSGKEISVNEVVKIVIREKELKPVHEPPVLEPKASLANIDKAKEFLNWQPKINFEEGMKETLGYFEEINKS